MWRVLFTQKFPNFWEIPKQKHPRGSADTGRSHIPRDILEKEGMKAKNSLCQTKGSAWIQQEKMDLLSLELAQFPKSFVCLLCSMGMG